MGDQQWPSFLPLLLISALLCLSLTQGSARNIKIVRSEVWGAAHSDVPSEGAEVAVVGNGREMAEMDLISAVDYPQPGANTNSRAGFLWGGPPPAPRPGH